MKCLGILCKLREMKLFNQSIFVGWVLCLKQCTRGKIYEGKLPPNQNLFIKKKCIYSYMFKLQSPSKYSQFDAIH